jgi:hypothetical protein
MKPLGYIGLDAAQRLETISVGLPTTITKHRAFNDDVELWASGWQPIETCPEDTNVLVATVGGWVDTAFWTDEDGEGRKWWWLIAPTKYEPHPIHPALVPTHWMPLPKHPEAT